MLRGLVALSQQQEIYIFVLVALALFVAMGLLRYTLRYSMSASRRRADGLRWRGIQWDKQEDEEEPEE